MKKITPAPRNELPKFSNGWEWRKFIDGTWSVVSCIATVYIDKSGMTLKCEGELTLVPFEVISAVLKANGVEL